MDFVSLVSQYSAPVIAAIVFILVQVSKGLLPDAVKKYLPLGCALLGSVLSVWIAGWQVSPEVILAGLASGFAATGLHQAGSQLQDDTKDINEE